MTKTTEDKTPFESALEAVYETHAEYISYGIARDIARRTMKAFLSDERVLQEMVSSLLASKREYRPDFHHVPRHTYIAKMALQDLNQMMESV